MTRSSIRHAEARTTEGEEGTDSLLSEFISNRKKPKKK
jgi:hypothetical protein